MPDFQEAVRFSALDLRVVRVVCDGHDGPTQAEECTDEDILVLALQGRFMFRNRSTNAVIGPSRGVCLRAGQPYTISHPHQDGDITLSVRGTGLWQFLGGDETVLTFADDDYLPRQRLLWTLASGAPLARLEIEELLAEGISPNEKPRIAGSRRDCERANEIAYILESRFLERLSLTELASVAGLSIFHTCRVFRRARGTSIHRYLQEIRLRHALALLLGTQLSVAQIAADTGFANQGHLGNIFRRRFGVTPARVRSTQTVLASPADRMKSQRGPWLHRTEGTLS